MIVNPVVAPKFSITDANGDRLLFKADLTPNPDVYSVLSNPSNGAYVLSGAGPPGAMREKGNYTYTFQQTSAQNAPLTTRLTSLADDLGNAQYLGYGNSALTVNDSSSGRILIFNLGASGYISSVDAPEVGGGIHTHTALTFDTAGHCTGVKVYDSTGSVLLHSDTFSYGGPNGDSVTASQQGAVAASFSYVSDGLGLDPFGLPVSRLASATYGAGGDSSSSDDGGSVAGTYSYTFGPTQQGYNSYGVDAHTNTVTDARGSSFSTLFSLTGNVYGAINGMQWLGPDYAGAPANSNHAAATYSPNINQPQTVIYTDPIAALNGGVSLQFTFDLLGNLTGVTDARGKQWEYAYTPDGLHLESVTDPTGVSASFAYGERSNPASRLTTIQSLAGGVTQIDYNSFGQPLAITTPAGSSASGLAEQTQFAYNAVTGDLAGVMNPVGDQMRVSGYDALGDPLGAILYPDTGNPATSQQPLVSSIAYDAAQMPVSIVGPSGLTLNTTFTNGVPTQMQMTLPANQGATVLSQMNLAYDSRGRVYQAGDLAGLLAQYRYDKNSNITQVWDGLGHITRFNYGKNNEPTGVQWPGGATTSVAYDAAGRVRAAADERFIVSQYVYDAASRLTDVQWPNYAAENTHYAYDDAGRLLAVTDRSGSRTYTYDPNSGRLLTVTTTYAALPAGHNTYVVSYNYYSDGSVGSRTGPDGTTSYQYDAAGHVTQLTASQGVSATYAYDHAGRATGQSATTAAGKTLATTYTWGVSGQLQPTPAPCYVSQITQTLNGQMLRVYTLTHRLAGQLASQTDGTNQQNVGGSEYFQYDNRGRLNSETVHWQADAQTNFDLATSYNSDAANNVSPNGVGTWQYNSNNQATSAPPRSVGGVDGLSGASGLAYDAAGNTTGLNGATLAYDCWGNLVGAGGATYTYDSAGRRISKTVSGTTTFFLYEGDTLIGEADASGNLTRSYVWGPQGLIADASGSGANPAVRLYGFDGMGNLRLLLDGSTGAVQWGGSWGAWGTCNYYSAPSTPFGYKGQTGAYTDGESGLVLMGARYYAPCLARFLSRDPSGFASGTNLYGFCLNDPVNFFDPDGCAPVDWTGMLDDFGRGLRDRVSRDLSQGNAAFNPFYGLRASAAAAGTAQGRYDSGKIGAGELAGAYADYGLHLANAATAIFGVGKAASRGRGGGRV